MGSTRCRARSDEDANGIFVRRAVEASLDRVALVGVFISALVRNGASIEVVRLLAGHSKLDVTQRYVHTEGAELRTAMSPLVTLSR